jgi:hypothetical protein
MALHRVVISPHYGDATELLLARMDAKRKANQEDLLARMEAKIDANRESVKGKILMCYILKY